MLSFQRTTVRALVPYKAPPNGVAVAFKALLRRVFTEADKHFRKGKVCYLALSLPAFWGLLLGGFLPCGFLPSQLSVFLAVHCFIVFLSGMTAFAIVLIPLSGLWVFSLIGYFVGNGLIDSVGDYVSLCFFSFSFLLLSCEGVFSWKRGLLGWRNLILHPHFLLFFLFLILSLIFVI